MDQSTALINAISQLRGHIVSDNIRVIAQREHDAAIMIKHFGGEPTGVDFSTLADLVANEMDISGFNHPFFLDEVLDIIAAKECEAVEIVHH